MGICTKGLKFKRNLPYSILTFSS